MNQRQRSPRLPVLLLATMLPLGCGTPAEDVSVPEPAQATQTQGPAEETVSETDRSESVEVRADFAQADEVERWRPVDDVVMGGVSSSSMRAGGEGTAVFSGEVSLDNNGGFASVRSLPRDWELGGSRGLALRVRGDGKTYKLGARTDGDFDGVTWQATFETAADTWTTVRVAYEEMEARWHGRLVPNAGALRPEAIRTLGLLISDKQEGPFRLEVAWIGGWR